MRNYQKSKLNMYNTVINYCKENAALIAAVPALQLVFTEFMSIVTQINTLMKQREMVTLGITEDKQFSREKLSDMAVVIASKIYAFANSLGNNEIKRLVDYSISDFLKLKDEELPVVCRNILDVANANFTPLQEYKLTIDLLDEFAEEITKFAELISRPRIAVSKRSGSLELIAKLFQQADRILKNSMDKIIREYKQTHPAFYVTYRSTRIIIDPASTSTQIKGIITNKMTDEKLYGATVTIMEIDQTAQTTAEGTYTMKELEADSYTVEVSKKGYKTKTVNEVIVISGKATKVSVALVPE